MDDKEAYLILLLFKDLNMVISHLPFEDQVLIAPFRSVFNEDIKKLERYLDNKYTEKKEV
jgi:hypothetical protein